MSSISNRYRKVAAGFTARVEAVPDDAWDNPAPCEGWVARDVVGHLAEWIPSLFFQRWDVEAPPIPSATDDPVGTWTALNASLQAALDDPEVAQAVRETQMGSSSFEQTFDMVGTSDVLLHTWDLARATGQDDTLDPDEVEPLLAGMEPMDQVLRDSGHFGPRVEVPDDASPQDKLIAFTGRRP